MVVKDPPNNGGSDMRGRKSPNEEIRSNFCTAITSTFFRPAQISPCRCEMTESEIQTNGGKKESSG